MRHADVGQTLRNVQASRQIIKAKRRIGLPQSPGNALHRLRRGRGVVSGDMRQNNRMRQRVGQIEGAAKHMTKLVMQ